ncbi:MAG: hypothetical protein WKG07_07365 [Hymenobacter sp.]
MATVLYNSRPTLRSARAFDSLLSEVLRDAQAATLPPPLPSCPPPIFWKRPLATSCTWRYRAWRKRP